MIFKYFIFRGNSSTLKLKPIQKDAILPLTGHKMHIIIQEKPKKNDKGFEEINPKESENESKKVLIKFR